MFYDFIQMIRRSSVLYRWPQTAATVKCTDNLHFYVINFWTLQVKDGKWHETVFKFDTQNLDALPVLDIAAHDIGDGNEQFGLEIGPVCFS